MLNVIKERLNYNGIKLERGMDWDRQNALRLAFKTGAVNSISIV